MNSRILFYGVLFLFLVVGPAIAAENPSASTPQIGGQSQQTISGTLENISDGSLSVKTSEGKTKNFTIKSDKKSRIQSIELKKGDRVVAQVDQQNQVVEVTRLGSGSGTPSGG